MPASQPANFNLQQFTDVGKPLVGGRLYTYGYGTTALKIAFTDPDGTVPHTYTADGAGGQYIALDARGELPAPLYLDAGSYDISLKRADGSTVWTRKADGVDNSLRSSMATLAASLGAALVGFTSASAGAAKRTVQDKLRDTISVKDFGAKGDAVTDDTAAIQAAINAAGTDQVIDFPPPSSSYWVTAPITLKPRVGLRGATKFGSGITADFDGAIFIGASQLWRTSLINLSLKNNNAGANAGCVKATFYQGKVEDCQFEANNGFGLYLSGDYYCVENEIRKNYFYHCKRPIYAPQGAAYNNTDAFIVENLFKGIAGAESHVYWYGASGSVFKGNHHYGSASRYYMELVAGINVDVDGNYLETLANARIYISPGNPGSWNLRGNRFWGGDGAGVDLNGNSQSLIELAMTPGLSQRVNITGSVFEGGANSVNIVRTNANINTTGHATHVINVSGDNILRGSYVLGANVFRADCAIRALDRIVSAAGQSIGMAGSVDRYTYTGATTDTVFLPNSATNNNLDNRTFRVYNDTSSTEVTVSTSSPYNGSKAIHPGDVMEFQNRAGTWYASRVARGPVLAYSTANRPSSLGAADAGFMYYGSGLVTPRMVFWNGSAYQDAAGTAI